MSFDLEKRAARNEARLQGKTYFTYPCDKHGRVFRYTATGMCKHCVAEAKVPAKQAEYWATVKDGVNARRRITQPE